MLTELALVVPILTDPPVPLPLGAPESTTTLPPLPLVPPPDPPSSVRVPPASAEPPLPAPPAVIDNETPAVDAAAVSTEIVCAALAPNTSLPLLFRIKASLPPDCKSNKFPVPVLLIYILLLLVVSVCNP